MVIFLRIYLGCVTGLLAIRSILVLPHDMSVTHVGTAIGCLAVVYFSVEGSYRTRAFVGICAATGVFGTTSLLFKCSRKLFEGSVNDCSNPDLIQLLISICGLIVFGLWCFANRKASS